MPTWLFRTSLLTGGGGSRHSQPDAPVKQAGQDAAATGHAGAAASGSGGSASQPSSQRFDLELREAPFGIEVSRRGGSGAAVFNTTGTRLVYKASGLGLLALRMMIAAGRLAVNAFTVDTTCG